ncbi:RNA recognition motif-containing protein [Toxoplasma gondii TgCatPRC2]|uniref:RNA recognition motif domain-containing protein n=13 Tax=Toxoplasma gondii TaxID=5811 RepID=B9PZ61_TOXGV|nr:RNA recognition motif-containing protein [Toxoplasma gondii ME49]EPR57531.1 RNA recognition motif-containing protein [Toxoplasma gondii GT1]ESS28954.1 RNA recognition motif-containing protein [Toxoplasma gondii VEG]KAF4644811.1 RNA recognition motif-containing protein [Toxoplasma gondii]KYK64168.1 RNA recognition motif-containing protein [Toxoplasma gondii TgCatPRC2]EPT27485.1 RNA recognition motif-containing protein [Toxoplasma gondii ME49]|eukprot:XP_018636181.1 RNA recognition motif-containing protein [Toxoplasma gondii ME49]
MKRVLECTLNVSSLTRNVREEHLREIFGLYGVVTSCTVAVDKVAGIPKGYAYVEFDSVREAELAREHLNQGMLDGRAMKVEFSSKVKEQRQAEKARLAAAAGPAASSGARHGGRGSPARNGLSRRGRSPPRSSYRRRSPSYSVSLRRKDRSMSPPSRDQSPKRDSRTSRRDRNDRSPSRRREISRSCSR